jgi:formylglycine-generating enzyme required for sulfatase activity
MPFLYPSDCLKIRIRLSAGFGLSPLKFVASFQTKTDPAQTPLPVNIPEAIALRNRREISKSLRPLMRKVASRLRQELDEEATVAQIAETQVQIIGIGRDQKQWFWSPVVRPEPERWLELAIVIEVTSLLDVWQDTIAEFQQLMERHGAFRDVRTWHLRPDTDGNLQLYLKTRSKLNSKPRSPKELRDSGGRRLILLLSDCTSTAWRSGKIPDLLAHWARFNPVTIVQLLPEPYWDRSALALGLPVAFKSRIPGALSRNWQMEGRFTQKQRVLLSQGLNVPVVTIEPKSIGKWARALAALGEQKTPGVVLDLMAFQAVDPGESVSEPLPARQLVRRFRDTASPKAQKLADMMAVLPVNWSVIQLLQKNLKRPGQDFSQETGALYLAEIFLSGLLRSVPQETGQNQNGKSAQPYDFVDGVRDVLLGTIPISEAQEVGEEVAEAIFKRLPQDIQERINADIERRFGDSLSYFEAFLIPDLPWGDEVATEIWPFAQVTKQVLRRWGGDYAALADALETSRKTLPIPVPLPLDWPDIRKFEFEAASIIVSSTSFWQINIQPFEFEIAILRLQEKQGFWGRLIGREGEVELEIVREPRQAFQLIEALDEEQGLILEMVNIPAGSFQMGAPANEKGRSDDEGPQHEVTVKSFLMGKYPVTQVQWRFVAGLPQENRELNPDPAKFKGDNRPVEKVSWYEAVEFCDRLSKFTGREYRLPTEAEWEYACRAGTTTPFHYGETITTDLANYNGERTYGVEPKGLRRGETTDIGNFPANAFGLYDMHGNVWEWCLDHWHENYEGAPKDGSAWLENGDNSRRMLRGGSWDDLPEYCRSASRVRSYPDVQNDVIGFRVVCSPPRTQ